MIPRGQTPIRVPAECQKEGERAWTLLEWLTMPGVGVRRGETVAWLGCIHSTRALSSPVSGRLSEHWAEEGSAVVGGQVVALVEAQIG